MIFAIVESRTITPALLSAFSTLCKLPIVSLDTLAFVYTFQPFVAVAGLSPASLKAISNIYSQNMAAGHAGRTLKKAKAFFSRIVS